MKKIAEISAIEESSSNYLYEKDVYDPDADPELNGEEDGFALPDLHQDIEDGIIDVQ